MPTEMELTLEQTQQGVSYEVSKDSILQAGNPVKEILLKLNLPDHRSILTDSKETYKDGLGALKLKNFKKDASLKLSSYQIKKGMGMSVQKSRVHKMAKFTRLRKEIMLG
ncbi:hypothetical protein Tco_0572701 [Tanacetum coccineum]